MDIPGDFLPSLHARLEDSVANPKKQTISPTSPGVKQGLSPSPHPPVHSPATLTANLRTMACKPVRPTDKG